MTDEQSKLFRGKFMEVFNDLVVWIPSQTHIQSAAESGAATLFDQIIKSDIQRAICAIGKEDSADAIARILAGAGPTGVTPDIRNLVIVKFRVNAELRARYHRQAEIFDQHYEKFLKI